MRMTEAQEMNAEQGDYIVDGLLYCGKCHTPKQAHIEVMGKIMTPMCLCKCEYERKQEEKAEWERQQASMIMKQLRQEGFTDQKLKMCRFECDDEKNISASNTCKGWAVTYHPKKKGLMILGDTGTGKTFLAASIANKLIDDGHRVIMTNLTRISQNLIEKKTKTEYMDSLASCELLILDDFGTERESDWMEEVTYNVIDARYRSGKPLIITTNIKPAEFINPSDMGKKRVYSRLMEMCDPVILKGSDRRIEMLKERKK